MKIKNTMRELYEQVRAYDDMLEIPHSVKYSEHHHTRSGIDNLIKEITEERNITTIINSHAMNSVMEIGEKIIFLKNGVLEWEGSKKNIFKTENEAVTDFVYSSNLYKKVRQMYLKK